MKNYTGLFLIFLITLLHFNTLNAQTVNQGTVAVQGWMDARGYGFDSNGNQYVAGASTGASSVTFPGGTALVNNGSYDGYLTKFNAAGVVQWIKSFTGTNYQEIQNMAIVGNDIYLSIYCRGISTIDGLVFDNTAPVNFPNMTNLLILKYSSTGVLQWSRSLICNKNIYGDVVAGNNYVAVAGSLSGNSTMGGINLDTIPTGGAYVSDVFITLLNPSTGAVMNGVVGGSSSSSNSKSAYWSGDNTLKVLVNPGANFSVSGQVFSVSGSSSNLVLNYSVNGNNLALTSSKFLENGYVELYPGESNMYYSVESFYNNVTVSGTHYSAPASGSVLRVYDENDNRTSYKVFSQTISALVETNNSLYLVGKIEKSGTIGPLNYSIAGFNYETFVAEADNSGGVTSVVQTFGNGSNYGQFTALSPDGGIGVLSQITSNTTFGGFTYPNAGNALFINTVLFHAVTCTSPTVTPSQTTITGLDGSNISFNVNTSGTNPKTIAWYKNGALIAGITQPELEFINAKTSVTGIYKAIVTNACGSVTSSGINVTINSQDGAGTVTGTNPSITTTSIIFPIPKVRGKVTKEEPTLTFPGLSGAVTYCIKLSLDSTLVTGVKSVCGLSSSAYLVNVNAPGARLEADGQIWYYQVAGVDAAGNQSQWSTTQSFAVENTVVVTNTIEYTKTKKILIYPNPASEVITILNADGNITITDVVGSLVYSGFAKELNISTFPKGVYFIKSGSETLKLVKE